MRSRVFEASGRLLAAGNVLLALALAFPALTGCGKDGGTHEEPEQWPALSSGLSASGTYLGDSHESGTGVMTVVIMDRSLTFNEALQSYIGPGESLTLSLGIPLAADASAPELPEGTYEASSDESHPEWTFCTQGIDRTTVNSYDEDGNISVTPVTGGRVTVHSSGDMYWISCSLDTEEGSYSREYVGKIRIANKSADGFVSNLSGDIACSPMQYAEMVYMSGDGVSDKWSLFLANGYTAEDGAFDEGFLISISAEPGHMSIPAGTYTVSEAEGSTAPGTVVPGYGPFVESNGSWFFSYTRGTLYAQIKSGQLVIRDTDDGQTAISLSFKDGNGYSLTASFSGIPELY